MWFETGYHDNDVITVFNLLEPSHKGLFNFCDRKLCSPCRPICKLSAAIFFRKYRSSSIQVSRIEHVYSEIFIPYEYQARQLPPWVAMTTKSLSSILVSQSLRGHLKALQWRAWLLSPPRALYSIGYGYGYDFDRGVRKVLIMMIAVEGLAPSSISVVIQKPDLNATEYEIWLIYSPILEFPELLLC
jgi:hypothetical protein